MTRRWFAALLPLMTLPALAQTPEQQVRQAEAAQVKAVLANDAATLETLWSPQMVVNNPANRIVPRAGVFARMKAGDLAYTAYVQTIENVAVFPGVVIVMGQEMTKPVNGPDAGKTEQRRFTDIWRKEGDAWLQIGRQATLISVT